jgi:hypothetical protein
MSQFIFEIGSNDPEFETEMRNHLKMDQPQRKQGKPHHQGLQWSLCCGQQKRQGRPNLIMLTITGGCFV